MPKDDLVYVGHMLDISRQALALVKGIEQTDYDDDEVLRLALTHLVQVIGEAARRLSPEFLATHPNVPWRAIIGMRHKIVHDYLDVDEDIVWKTVVRELPPLVTALTMLLPEEN